MKIGGTERGYTSHTRLETSFYLVLLYNGGVRDMCISKISVAMLCFPFPPMINKIGKRTLSTTD